MPGMPASRKPMWPTRPSSVAVSSSVSLLTRKQPQNCLSHTTGGASAGTISKSRAVSVNVPAHVRPPSNVPAHVVRALADECSGRCKASGPDRIAGKNAIPGHQCRPLIPNRPDRREDGRHSKANARRAVSSHTNGPEGSITPRSWREDRVPRSRDPAPGAPRRRRKPPPAPPSPGASKSQPG